ncbi:3-oxoacyl-[acyl-carrier-protein] reductase FabG [Sodalis glossinidius str. 'morsitans']|uniref:3-oxoacyl-[acyl-carrier-protein] reductase FabG n=1 Tax=Sodalis glossinidius (strain morsitans) TaxID=343509 RepID=A0A193QMK2_SODGM|nr:SDR family oxidoreductase [Sodalis glossinidius]CRL46449.1 3-oxoacyl-[acyl-carrier-protein] reductase FabG [Sodalis glossinidius str. 'morsitans']
MFADSEQSFRFNAFYTIGTYHSHKEEAQALVKEIEWSGGNAAMLQLDTGDSRRFGDFASDLQQLLSDKFNQTQFHHLVNNAGIGIHAPFTATDEEQFDQLMRINFKGPFFLTRALLPLLADGGSILNMSSGLTRFTTPGFAAYAATKGAMEVLTRYQVKELGGRGIRVNILAPGAIESDFAGGTVRDNKQVNQVIADNTVLGRVGLPDDIGATLVALLSDNCHWMTAQRVEASGGMYL